MKAKDDSNRPGTLTFTPYYKRVAKKDVIVIKSDVHQRIGRLECTLKTDVGEVIAIKDVACWVDDQHTKELGVSMEVKN
jgi:hypothetical protein